METLFKAIPHRMSRDLEIAEEWGYLGGTALTESNFTFGHITLSSPSSLDLDA